MDEYLKSLKPVPSPYLIMGELTPAAEHGKELFFSKEVGCATCHPSPLYTDLKEHDVGTIKAPDKDPNIDTPTLIECWRTAPYLHDGHYTTIKQLLTEGKHGAKGSGLEKLTPQEMADLVEFVLSL